MKYYTTIPMVRVYYSGLEQNSPDLPPSVREPESELVKRMFPNAWSDL